VVLFATPAASDEEPIYLLDSIPLTSAALYTGIMSPNKALLNIPTLLQSDCRFNHHGKMTLTSGMTGAMGVLS
jgi:hypothetical protein